MSEQARILAEIHELIMSVLQAGSASVEQGDKLDELEELLFKQNCFIEINHPKHTYQGEEIASLFFGDNNTQAIDKMIESEITPEDFFGFVGYHYDEDHEDEALTEMFTNAFMADVNKAYQLKSQS